MGIAGGTSSLLEFAAYIKSDEDGNSKKIMYYYTDKPENIDALYIDYSGLRKYILHTPYAKLMGSEYKKPIETNAEFDIFYEKNYQTLEKIIKDNNLEEYAATFEKLVNVKVWLISMFKICKYICKLVKIIRPTKRVNIAFEGKKPEGRIGISRYNLHRLIMFYDGETNKNLLLSKSNHISTSQTDDYLYQSVWEGNFDFFNNKIELGFAEYRVFIGKQIEEMVRQTCIDNLISDDIQVKSHCKIGESFGEGEFIIFQDIKKYSNPEEKIIIYGRDTDIIILSLAQEKHIILFEEFEEKKKDWYMRKGENLIPINENKDDFHYLDLKILRNNIFSKIQWKINNFRQKSQLSIKINERKIINDFIGIFQLFGNDFIPKIPFFNTFKMFHQIFNIYSEIIAESITKIQRIPYLVIIDNNKADYNLVFLRHILYKIESNLLKNNMRNDCHILQKEDIRINIKNIDGLWKNIYTNPLFEDCYFDWNSLGESELFPDKIFEGGFENRKSFCFKNFSDERKIYYSHFFKENIKINHICLNYIETIKYMLGYFFRLDINLNNFYQFPIAPLTSDILYFLDILLFNFIDTKFINFVPINRYRFEYEIIVNTRKKIEDRKKNVVPSKFLNKFIQKIDSDPKWNQLQRLYPKTSEPNYDFAYRGAKNISDIIPRINVMYNEDTLIIHNLYLEIIEEIRDEITEKEWNEYLEMQYEDSPQINVDITEYNTIKTQLLEFPDNNLTKFYTDACVRI